MRAAVLFALALTLPWAALPPTSTFSGNTEVLAVEIPVTVSYRGQSLAGLGVEDFEVLVDGEPAEITGFEELDASAAEVPADSGAASRESRFAHRNRLYWFDLAYADSRRLEAARAALGVQLATEEGGDRVGLAFSSANQGFQWVLPLTADRAALEAGLEVLAGVLTSSPERVTAGLGRLSTDARVDPAAILAEAGLSAANRYETDWPHATVMERITAELTTALTETNELDGRKYLIHLSYGMPDRYVSGKAWDRPRILGQLTRLTEQCRASGWQVQSINLGGLGFGRDALLMLAHDTGGSLHTNSNDTGLLLREADVVTRQGYLLVIAAPAQEDSSSWRPNHQLRVRLIGGPAGARVHHRASYSGSAR